MKKIMALLVSIMMLLSAVSAGAQAGFMAEFYPNYTAESSMKFSFDNSEEVVELLKEVDFPEEVENYVDLKALLESILTYDSAAVVQFDVSDDMKVVKMAVTSETQQFIKVNTNLSADINTKFGMWVNLDIRDEENPVFDVIYMTPATNKYMVIDIFEVATEKHKDNVMKFVKMFFNKEFIDAVNSEATELINKYASVTLKGKECVVKIDNEAFINIARGMVAYGIDFAKEMVKGTAKEMSLEETIKSFEAIDLSDIRILGDKGIKYTYELKNKKATACFTSADISVDVAGIYSKVSGEEWEYNSEGKLDFTFESSVKMVNVGVTKVAFPEITAENSFKLEDRFSPYDDYVPDYPYYYVGSECDSLPVINEEIYVPLKRTIYEAYEDSASVSFEKGVVTLTSDCFPGFKTLSVKKGDKKAVSDTGEYDIIPMIIEDGVSYVSVSFFEEIFGWMFESAYYDTLNEVYSYAFTTESYEPYEAPVPKVFVYTYSGETKMNESSCIPLRETLVYAYGEENISIGFEKGVITLSSEYFPGFKTLTIKNGDDKAYTDTGASYDIGKVKIKSGVTCVSKEFFENALGWTTEAAEYNLLDKTMDYTFYTGSEY